MTELALIKLTRPETSNDAAAVLARLERLERRQARGDTPAETTSRPVPAAVSSANEQPPAVPDPSQETVSPPEEIKPAATVPNGESHKIEVSLEQLKAIWPGLFGSLREVLGARRWAFFREAVPTAVEGNVLVLEVAHDFHLQSLQEDDAVAKIVGARASELLKAPVHVRFALRETTHETESEIDMDDLDDRPQATMDPLSLLTSELGAEVVDG
jgi:hypothetical protein